MEDEQYKYNNIKYKRLSFNWRGWYGFTFNPGIRRLNDYKLLSPYSQYKMEYKSNEELKLKTTYSKFFCPEQELSKMYYNLGYYAIILNNSAIKHIGWNNHII